MQKTIDYIKESLKAYYPETEISGFTRIIIEHITSQSYPQALLKGKELSETEKTLLQKMLDRLKEYEPIQYITEGTEFFGLPLFLNKNVLIPRPETEELVELILNENNQKGLRVLDIGTGSGAIAIALAKHLKNVNVTAWDISYKALDIAVLNSKKNNVDVNFKKIDILGVYPQDEKFDIIVSNPPYIMESEKSTMEQNVLNYEPHTALFVPDNRALLFYERIADIAPDILTPGGRLYFEINHAKGKNTVKLLQNKGFTDVVLFQDISRKDRMVRAILP